ncbi:MAG: cation-transporting P-type ATPase, partial [Promethearchaeota archaeon]
MTTAARRIEGHAIALDHLFHILNTDEHGLSEDEVIKRLETIGPNEIPQVKGSIWEVYLAPLFNWLITTYLVMTGILFVLALAYPEAWT